MRTLVVAEHDGSSLRASSLACLGFAKTVVEAAGGEKESFCRACFYGEYPIDVPEGAGKFVLEDQLRLPTA